MSGFLHFPSGFFHHFKCLTSWAPCLLTGWRPLLGLLGRLSRPPGPVCRRTPQVQGRCAFMRLSFQILDHSLDSLQSAFCTPRRVALKWCLTSMPGNSCNPRSGLSGHGPPCGWPSQLSSALHCWNPTSASPFTRNIVLLAHQLSRNIGVVSVCRCPLTHPSGVVDTPQASACSRSRRASISKRRGSVPCISPCCERLQTTAATLKARGGALHPRRPSPTNSGIFIRTGCQGPVFPRSIKMAGTSVQHFGPPPVAGPRPPQNRALSFSAPPGSDTDPGSLSARLLRRKGGLFFLGSPSRPMSRPVKIHDRRLGGQARDPPTPWALLSWLTCAALRSAG